MYKITHFLQGKWLLGKRSMYAIWSFISRYKRSMLCVLLHYIQYILILFKINHITLKIMTWRFQKALVPKKYNIILIFRHFTYKYYIIYMLSTICILKLDALALTPRFCDLGFESYIYIYKNSWTKTKC